MQPNNSLFNPRPEAQQQCRTYRILGLTEFRQAMKWIMPLKFECQEWKYSEPFHFIYPFIWASGKVWYVTRRLGFKMLSYRFPRVLGPNWSSCYKYNFQLLAYPAQSFCMILSALPYLEVDLTQFYVQTIIVYHIPLFIRFLKSSVYYYIYHYCAYSS